jgi:hypothetical protein
MTDLRQAAQQALKALETADEVGFWELQKTAITALRTALAQPEQEPVAHYHPHNGFYWAKPTKISAPTIVSVPRMPLYTTPPAAKPEPMRLYVEDFARRCGWGKDSGEGAFEYVQRKSYAQGLEDAAAPAAQRKPLTGGEIYTAYITAANQTLRPQDERIAFAFARAIEAAHGIKEGT